MRALALALFILIAPFFNPAFGQGPTTMPTAIDCSVVACTGAGGVAMVPATQSGGGIIQLKAFGWLEPYVDTLVQTLIMAAFAWFAKTKYGQMLDDTSRAALETFLKNRASSLIADGAVRIEGKSIDVHSEALQRAAAEASTAIPDALKRFNLTPDKVAAKIIDAIPQTAAGAAIVAEAHKAEVVPEPPVKIGNVNISSMKAPVDAVSTIKTDTFGRPATPTNPPTVA
jgi:hypothetical protein